jgi:hypothetical protein
VQDVVGQGKIPGSVGFNSMREGNAEISVMEVVPIRTRGLSGR